MKTRLAIRLKIRLTVLSAMILAVCVSGLNAQTQEFVRQFGSSANDSAKGICTTSDGIYVAGMTAGNFGARNAGQAAEGFLSKFGFSGQLIWTQLIDDQMQEVVEDVCADEFGDLYVVGSVQQGKGSQAVIYKFDSDGNAVWTETTSTTLLPQVDEGKSIASDGAGGIFIAGLISDVLKDGSLDKSDAFVSEFDLAGSPVWSQRFGTPDYDEGLGVAVAPDGYVYVTGKTAGESGVAGQPTDFFVAKFDASGNDCYFQEFGTEGPDKFDVAFNVVATDEGAFVTGVAGDAIDDESGVAFLAQIDTEGALVWARQFGSAAQTAAQDVALMSNGNIVITGVAHESLAGASSGFGDSFVSVFNPLGWPLWKRQLGTSGFDQGVSIDVDQSDRILIAGDTQGDIDFDDNVSGGMDFFIGSYVPVPRPIKSTPETFSLFRGTQLGGEIVDLAFSDDSTLDVQPGFVLNELEAPVWIVVEGNLVADLSAVDFQIETSANTPGLTYTVEFWNWNTSSYDTVGVAAESFNVEFFENYGGVVADHVRAGDSAVQARVGWRSTGFTLVFPWEVRIDQLAWNASQ